MLDSRSRKILKYIRKHKQASFREILKLYPNEALTADILVTLNLNRYTVQVKENKSMQQGATYELLSKGYAELEEYRYTALYNTIPLVISALALLVSILR